MRRAGPQSAPAPRAKRRIQRIVDVRRLALTRALRARRARPPGQELLSLHNPVARAARALASRVAREGLYWFSKVQRCLVQRA